MQKISQCPNCKSSQITTLRGYKAHYLSKCKKCGLVFSHTLPNYEEIVNVYDNYSRDDYLSDVTIKRYNELLDSFEKYRKTNKLLDIGCGIGYFLEVAKQRGWEVYGTEFSDKAVEICKEKGINMFQGALTKDTYNENEFDIITTFEVIEHISNPHEIMQYIPLFLRPKGLFYLTTPNYNSLIRILQKNQWDVFAYPEHLDYYTKRSIKSLLKAYHIQPIFIHTHGLSLSRLKAGIRHNKPKENYISAVSTDEKIRVSMEKSKVSLFIKKQINAILSLLCIGDSLKVMGVNMK